MTDPAYDMRYDMTGEVPRRTAIDPVKTVDALRYGWIICHGCGYEPKDIQLENMVWALLVEAARIERELPGVGGVGFPSAWPEIWRSGKEKFEAQVSRLASGMPEYENDRRGPKPTAAQISRYSEVILWLRFCHAADKIQAVGVLWGRASGIPYPKLRDATGLSVQRLRGLKSEQLRAISKRLKHELSAGEMTSAFHG